MKEKQRMRKKNNTKKNERAIKYVREKWLEEKINNEKKLWKMKKGKREGKEGRGKN